MNHPSCKADRAGRRVVKADLRITSMRYGNYGYVGKSLFLAGRDY